jgi:hypothetical protein
MEENIIFLSKDKKDVPALWKQMLLYNACGLYITLNLIVFVFLLIYAPIEPPFLPFVAMLCIYNLWKCLNLGWGIVLTAKLDYFFWEQYVYYFEIVQKVHIFIGIGLGSTILIIYFISLPGASAFPLSSLLFQILMILAADFGTCYGMLSLIGIMYVTDVERAPNPFPIPAQTAKPVMIPMQISKVKQSIAAQVQQIQYFRTFDAKHI